MSNSWKVKKCIDIVIIIMIVHVALIFLIAFILIPLAETDSCNNIEFPMNSVSSFAVDSKGNIYCAISFFRRVQVYNKKGEFINGFFVDSWGGILAISVKKDDEITVGSTRTGNFSRFAQDGKLLGVESGDYSKMNRTNKNPLIQVNNVEYKIEHPQSFPVIVQRKNNHREVIVSQSPLYLYLGGGGAFKYFFILLLIVRFFYRRVADRNNNR